MCELQEAVLPTALQQQQSSPASKSSKKYHKRQQHQQEPLLQENDPDDPDWILDGTPYKVKISPIMGRYLVAARDLSAGEVILEEEALVAGPCQNTKPVCLGCHRVFDTGSCVRCLHCQWPMCSHTCPGLGIPGGHSRAECAALATSGRLVHDLHSRTPLYNVIVPLRILLLRDGDPPRWSAVHKMQSHDDIRRQLPNVWQANQVAVVDRIRNELGMKQFTEEEIHSVCGILEVNAFEVGQSEQGESIRALFDRAFLLAHDCTPNTSHTDDDRRQLTVRASVPIPRGHAITLSYAYTLQGTLKRREHLRESKFFDCCCARCSDPTELGTMCSALLCPKCETGAVLPTDPLQADAPWRCRKSRPCPGYELAAEQAKELLDKLGDEIEALDANDVSGLEAFIEKYSSRLHPNHYHIVGAKHSLSQLYGKVHGYLIHQLPDALLQRKLTICKEILRVFDVLEPGITRLRGITLYEMHAPIMILTNRQYESRTITRKELKNRLKQVASCLEQASAILQYEPETSSEGAMGRAATDALERVRQWQ